jgi:hypothetical protein
MGENMRKKSVIALISVLTLIQPGCATIVSGKTQDVIIRSNPPGATVKIDEMVSGTTPMVANLVRKKRHAISISKSGFQEVTQATTRGFNGWYLGNILLGGIIGLITDPITGAMYDVEPSEINVNLPEQAAPQIAAVPMSAGAPPVESSSVSL